MLTLTTRLTPIARATATVALLLGMSSGYAQTAHEAELARRLDQLSAELASVRAQLVQLQQATPAAAPATAGSWTATTAAPASASAPVAQAAAPAPAADGPSTVLSSYGEINYNRASKATDQAGVDISRFVLGIQHRIDARTKIVGELEVEHAVSSADDPGEVEVEQAYVERQLTDNWAARAGVFLIPAGLLNENHEPTVYYGVTRNFVETAIIPTTWREAGITFIGNLDNGLTVQAGLSTSFDLTKWDAASTEGTESPLGAVHQEAALAKARNVAAFGAINWRGVPGLLLGASLFSGGATHKTPTFPNSRITLGDLHARWTPGRWDLAAVYARGTISNTGALNTPLVGNPTLIPKTFDGWYTQAAYRLWQHGDYVLTPFARFEQFNTARSYADIGLGLTPPDGRTESVSTVGASLHVTPSVVLKADLQHFRINALGNRLNLGLGWSF